ncbi:YebC/PmpR family DNA-binding transcriptional regulator [Haloplasma contractile]|uniref:Probable transcriptional regulatory protein HLPCO_000525 n=1 Tax=Haloplasma contractile SSD-17B TaxID=1033810 RepID=U2FSE5_9MOLU|nr:YebC/PmpR family DNA-binding transcriptional regulator [Haloplasma contractile]ERJ13859.1 Transcriptional regulator protein [Haloplasma contractile SSD-17B]
MGRAFEVRKASMAKTNAKKAKIYGKYGKEIYLAAKNGEPDPELNITLKRIIEKARKDQVPNDIIKRAVDKAKSGVAEDYQAVQYEGFGPGSCTVIVECLTDNVNRSVSEVRNCFTKTDSKLGVSGSVSFMYNHNAVVSFSGLNEEETLEALLMADVDVEEIEEEDGMVTVYGTPHDLYNIKTVIEETKEGIEFEMDEITWIPQNYVELEGEDRERFDKMMNMLDEVDDVTNVYHNVKSV